jgi:hypothetical protein
MYVFLNRSSSGQTKKAAFSRGISTFDGKECKSPPAKQNDKKEVEKLIEEEKREKGKVNCFVFLFLQQCVVVYNTK